MDSVREAEAEAVRDWTEPTEDEAEARAMIRKMVESILAAVRGKAEEMERTKAGEEEEEGVMVLAEEEAAVLVTMEEAAEAGPAASPSSVLAPPDRFEGGAPADFALKQHVEAVNREVAAALELAAVLQEWELVEQPEA